MEEDYDSCTSPLSEEKWEELNLLELELATTIQRMMRLDIFGGERVERILRQVKHQELLKTTAH